VSRFLLARIARARRKGVVERLPIDVLRMGWKPTLDRGRQVRIGLVWHALSGPFDNDINLCRNGLALILLNA